MLGMAGPNDSGHLDSRNRRQAIRFSEHRNQNSLARQLVGMERVPLADAREAFELVPAARLEKHTGEVRNGARLGFGERAVARDDHIAPGEKSPRLPDVKRKYLFE